jgi:hypothetical protein
MYQAMARKVTKVRPSRSQERTLGLRRRRIRREEEDGCPRSSSKRTGVPVNPDP